MKKLLSLSITAAIWCHGAMAANFTADGITYSVIDGAATPSVEVAVPETPYSGDIVIPATVSNAGTIYKVVAIGDMAFAASSYNLSSISLPEGLERIGAGAFVQCSSIPEIIIPNSVVSVGDEAFYGCMFASKVDLGTGLRTIGVRSFAAILMCPELKIPDSVVSIGASAFHGFGSSCESLTLGSGIEEIGAYAFFNFALISEVTVPEGVKKIGNSAFEQCNMLTTFNIPASVAELGTNPVSGDKLVSITVSEGNPVCKAVDGVLFNKDMSLLIAYPAGKPGSSYTIPSQVRTIGFGAFSKAANLTDMTIPEGVETVEAAAFYYSTALKSVTTPSSLKTIHETAFYQCFNLEDVNLGEGLEELGYSAFAYCTDKLKTVRLPRSLKTMGSGVFYCCNSLEEIEIPESVKDLPAETFMWCPNLKAVRLNEGLVSIGSDAMNECGSLLGIDIPNSVKTIGTGAFFNCTSMQTTTLGAGLTTLPDFLYGGCTAITRVTSLAQNPPANPSFEREVYENAVLAVPSRFMNAYKDDPDWGYFSQIVEAPGTELPEKLYINGSFVGSGWVEPVQANADQFAAWTLTQTADGSGVYTATVTLPAGEAMFRFYTTLDGWDTGSIGAQLADAPVRSEFTKKVFNGTCTWGKGSWCFTLDTDTPVEMTVNLDKMTVKFTDKSVDGAIDAAGDDSGWSVEATPSGLRVSGAEAAIYDTAGRIVARGSGEIPLGAHGVFIVRAGNRSVKIIR